MLTTKHKFIYITIGMILIALVRYILIKEIKFSMSKEKKIPKILIYTQAR